MGSDVLGQQELKGALLKRRVVLLVCLWAAYAALLFSGLHGSWAGTWTRVGVNAFPQPFADIRTIPHAVVLHKAGLDPYQQGPGFTSMNYPRIWIWGFSIFHLDDHVVGSEIGIIALVLLCFSHLILVTKRLLSAVAVWMATFSSAVLLLVERGNTDMAAFVLVYLAANSGIGAVVVGFLVLAALLKLYPALGLLAAFLEPRVDRRWVAVGLLAVLAYVAFSQADIRRIQQNTPHSILQSYGVSFLAEAMQRRWHAPVRVPLMLFAGLVSGALAIMGWRSQRGRVLPSGPATQMYLLFSTIFLGTFLVTPNFEYRLVFLVPTLPFWCELLACEGDRLLAMVGLVLTLVSLDSPLLHVWGPLRGSHHVARVLLFLLATYLFGRVVRGYAERLPLRRFVSGKREAVHT